MNYYQEKIDTDALIPAKIYIGKSDGNNCHYPMHWHNNLEFDLVLEGKIKGRINRKVIDVPAGEFFFVNSGDLHETDAQDRSKMNSITVLLSYDLIKEYCPNIDEYHFDFNEKEDTKLKIKSLILKCSEVYQKKEEFYELDMSILLRSLCSILLKECRRKKGTAYCNKQEQKNIINIKKAITYIEQHYEEDLSLHKIAAEIGMAHTYFSRFFKKTTGETFYTYLHKTRLYHAHQELMNTDASITEIAFNNGFSNVKAFIEFFKGIYKMTPGKYRKLSSS